MTIFDDPRSLAQELERVGHIVAPELATTCVLAHRLGKPLLCEGSPGVGKTSLARALARASGGPFIRLQCHDGLEASQALYDWDFAKQILHVRTIEAASGSEGERIDALRLDDELHDRAFLLARPILRAIEDSRGLGPDEPRPVLLIDEVLDLLVLSNFPLSGKSVCVRLVLTPVDVVGVEIDRQPHL